MYDKFEKLYKEMKQRRSPFEVIYGYVWDTERAGITHTDINDDEKDLLTKTH